MKINLIKIFVYKKCIFKYILIKKIVVLSLLAIEGTQVCAY